MGSGPLGGHARDKKMDIGLWKMDNGQKEKEKGKWKMASDKKQVASKREMVSEMI